MAKSMPKTKRGSTKKKPALMDIRTVAQKAKVSIATVSRTINHNPSVNARMAKRVWDAIRELDYFPNPRHARWFRAAVGCLALSFPKLPTRSSRS